MAIAVGATMAMAQDEPVYPTSLDFTLNGEKELSGVSVSQNMVPYDGTECLSISITGECSADAITMDFQTPEGWDYALIASIMEDEDNPFKTRSSHWIPVSTATAQGYTEGNTFNFPVNGTKFLGTIYLVSDDNVWEYPIDIYYEVYKTIVDNGEFEYPEHISMTLNGEKELPGVTVKQEIYVLDGYENLSISINGECDAEEITVDLATPAGWDGMLISNPKEAAALKPSKIKVKDESMFWGDIDQAQGVTPGNTLKFKVNGIYQSAFAYLTKDGKFYSLPIEIYFKVAKSAGSGDDPIVDDEPKFPETIEYTINGEAEIPGVNVSVTSGANGISMDVAGKSKAEDITLTIAVPEGWDGWLISAPWGEVSDLTATRSEEEIDTQSVDYYLSMGYIKGNSVTFLVEEESNYAELVVYKDGKVCPSKLLIEYNVQPDSTSVDPVEGPEFPENIVVTLYDEGLNEEQEWDETYQCQAIYITGTIEGDEYSVVLDVPEGWTGFIGIPYDENVTISDYNSNPRKSPSLDHEWCPISDFEEMGYVIGNKFTFKTNPEDWEMVDLFLYKDDQVDYNAYISLMALVSTKTEPVEYPDSYEVTLSNNEGVEVSQGEEMEVYTISVTGKSKDTELTITLDVPEGWDGFISMNDIDGGAEIEPLSTRAEEAYWVPVEEALELGFKEGNTMTFPVDGLAHSGQFYLCKDGMADMGNQVMIEFEVEYDDPSGVAGVNAAENASYYDLQGNQINNPKIGMYVKVVDGKASKVVVK